MSLDDYLTVIRRRKWLVLLFVLVTPAAAVGYSLTQKSLYSAESQVLINRQTVANQLSGGADAGDEQQSFEQILVTQSRIARTPVVLAGTLSRAGIPDGSGQLSTLTADSTAKASPDADLLLLTVTRATKEEALRLSAAYARSYVADKQSLDGAALEGALRDVQAAINRAKRQGTQAAGLLASLTSNQRQLETNLALATQNAQIASIPDTAVQVQPTPVRDGVIGLVIGVILGVCLALLRDVLDTRVRSALDLEDALGVSTLALIPKLRRSSTLVMREAPATPAAESFRLLRTNLSFGLLSHKAKVVMVTSATQGEGKSTTIANLAVAESIAGKRVALVDLDLRRPSIAALFGIDSMHGLTSAALGTMSLEEVTTYVAPLALGAASVDNKEPELAVVPSGPLPPNPAEFVGASVISTLIDELREKFDLVLIDAPPLIGVSETTVLASHVDAIFLCARLGVVRRPMLRDLGRGLARIDKPVLGLVVTGAAIDPTYYGYQSYPPDVGSDTKRAEAVAELTAATPRARPPSAEPTAKSTPATPIVQSNPTAPMEFGA